jgi:hypothetical protein
MAFETLSLWIAGTGDMRDGQSNTWNIHMRSSQAREVVRNVLQDTAIGDNQELLVIEGIGRGPWQIVSAILGGLHGRT